MIKMHRIFTGDLYFQDINLTDFSIGLGRLLQRYHGAGQKHD